MPLDSICINAESFELAGGSPAGGLYFGDGVIDGFFTPSNAGIGTHNIGYTYENENLCTDTAYQAIIVMSLPDVSFDPIPSVCLDAVAFELTGGIPEGGTYSGNAVIDNIFHPETAGIGEHSIEYSIVDANGCPNSTSQSITVHELPVVNIGNDTTLCGTQTITLDASIANASSYLWSPGGETTPSIVVDSVGIGYGSQEYGVIATDNNLCSDDNMVSVTFINCTGIEDIIGLEVVSLYPNPNDGTFNLKIEAHRPITIDVKIFDVFGTKHFEKSKLEISSNYSSKVSLTDPKPGIYFISIENTDGSFIKKFLIK